MAPAAAQRQRRTARPQEPSPGSETDEPAFDLDAALQGRSDHRDRLAAALVDFRLTPREAKVLMALVQAGRAPVTRIAGMVDVERANVYRVLEALAARRLAIRAPRGAEWSAPARADIAGILLAEEEKRHRALRARSEVVRQLFESMGPPSSEATPSFVHPITRVMEVAKLYDRLIREAQTEILVSNKAPYGGRAVKVIVWPSVVEAVARGVRVRALYEAHELDAAASEALRYTRVAYDEVGVEGRVVEQVPLRLAVFDRRRALLALNDPDAPERFPTNLFVDHPAFAEFTAQLFDHLWSTGRAYARPQHAAGRSAPRSRSRG